MIIKCDDDIVYIDVDRFESFIQARRDVDWAIMFSPSVVNNPVCGSAQFKNGILPGFKDTDFSVNADAGIKIHKYFLKNKKLFMADSFKTDPFTGVGNETKARFNINFIAILAKDLDELFDSPYLAEDDEAYLGVYAPRYFNRCVCIHNHFVVAHMAYTSQRNGGMDESQFLEKYRALIPKM